MVCGTAKWSAKGKDAQGKEEPWGGLATHIFKRQPDGSLKLQLIMPKLRVASQA
jgi:ketosteroid isomerase-like protein